MVAFLSELNCLDLWATDIGNAYLEAKTSELLFIVAGPEFGDFEGHISLSTKHYMDFVPQVYDGMNASPPVFETWASSLARLNQISG
jgi:hypothetical protein